jgi:hypothetical protein
MEFGLLSIIGAHTQLEIDEGKLQVRKDGFIKKKRVIKLRKNNKEKVENNDAR